MLRIRAEKSRFYKPGDEFRIDSKARLEFTLSTYQEFHIFITLTRKRTYGNHNLFEDLHNHGFCEFRAHDRTHFTVFSRKKIRSFSDAMRKRGHLQHVYVFSKTFNSNHVMMGI